MITSGAWNDEMCDKQHPFVCQRVRTYSYCAAAAEAGKFDQCGYDGVRKGANSLLGDNYSATLTNNFSLINSSLNK